MKKLLTVSLAILLIAVLIMGCGQKQEQDAGKVPAEVKKAEQADSTRMDSALIDTTMVDTMEVQQDTP